ncbi:hypothetical protein OPT61_g9042 [Boeremia exigua]|uniref:Uncharacterized protein n=1 Tax=Boeremia exigua TaxID=749465 RepID=A0ACC2HVQ6_9PLEO|nr:hypothetical protein OPT61_g9042 [Boeremia exigua]
MHTQPPPTTPAHTAHTSTTVSSVQEAKRETLTILNPSTILHQNSTLFSSVLPLTHLLLCTITIGICSIIAQNPYPRNLRRPREVRFRRAVDVAPEEVVHGDVPLAREFEPVAGIPPVGVELAVCEAWRESVFLDKWGGVGLGWEGLTRYLGKGAEDVLEDNEEGEQEGDHEGEEETADGLAQDQGKVARAPRVVQRHC